MDQTLVNRFYRLTESIRKFALSNFQAKSVSKSEYFILLFIEFINDSNQIATTAMLSERTDHSKPAVSQMINVLEKKGYVIREICENDRRQTRVLLTDLGRSVLAKEKCMFLKKIESTLDRMGREDSEVFIGLLEKYFEIIKDLHKENT
ncbi:MAG: hypothetical protein BGN88_11675 [Clostridiales bacterium 43-6]|nr:MAG: hypothetical protein BGN88_11675 [Clostridiales bacterium 43-6]